MPIGGPSAGGGALSEEVAQIVATFQDVGGATRTVSESVMQYVRPARKWLVTCGGYQTYNRGAWFMTDNPLSGQYEEIPNVPYNNPATDWLHLVGVFRDRLVFCNRTGATYRWYQCSLDFSVWQEIGSMVPFASATLGTRGSLSDRWAFLNTIFGEMYIVQGSLASAARTCWFTTDLGANWYPHVWTSSGWAAPGAFGNFPAADGLPGNEYFMLSTRNVVKRMGQPFLNPFPGPGIDFPGIENVVVTPSNKGQFLALPDGRVVITSVGKDFWYSTDNGATFTQIPVPGIWANNFSVAAGFQILAHDEKTDDILMHQRNVTWRTSDFISWQYDRAVAANREPNNDGTAWPYGGWDGEFFFVAEEDSTASVPFYNVVRL